MIQNHITIDGQKVTAKLEEAKASNESDVLTFFRDEEKIPLNKLTKYYLNENLNFLCGSGTSDD
ncbi:MAG: hypothetical protein LBE13_19450 [Bacteroidales bacterium]|jgi:hypothetical protein|nr:hypothetical protein [Bacteroidales bacterium]